MKSAINTISHIALTLLLLIFPFSCKEEKNKKNESEDSKDIAEKFNEAKFKDSKEAEFLVDAAAFVLQQIDIGSSAQKVSEIKNTREIGKSVETDYKKLYEELKELSGNKQITIPAVTPDKEKNDLNKLNEKSGEEFDKQLCELLVEEHKDAIKKFEKAKEDCEDIDVKNWITKTLPLLRHHLDKSMVCHEGFTGKAGTDIKKEIYNSDKKQSSGSLEESKNLNNNKEGGKTIKDRDKSKSTRNKGEATTK